MQSNDSKRALQLKSDKSKHDMYKSESKPRIQHVEELKPLLEPIPDPEILDDVKFYYKKNGNFDLDKTLKKNDVLKEGKITMENLKNMIITKDWKYISLFDKQDMDEDVKINAVSQSWKALKYMKGVQDTTVTTLAACQSWRALALSDKDKINKLGAVIAINQCWEALVFFDRPTDVMVLSAQRQYPKVMDEYKDKNFRMKIIHRVNVESYYDLSKYDNVSGFGLPHIPTPKGFNRY